MTQDASGVRVPASVAQGGTITVEVGGSEPSIELNVGASGEVQSVPVPPDKRVQFQVPPVAPGTILLITVGRGAMSRVFLVEVVATPPD